MLVLIYLLHDMQNLRFCFELSYSDGSQRLKPFFNRFSGFPFEKLTGSGYSYSASHIITGTLGV